MAIDDMRATMCRQCAMSRGAQAELRRGKRRPLMLRLLTRPPEFQLLKASQSDSICSDLLCSCVAPDSAANILVPYLTPL